MAAVLVMAATKPATFTVLPSREFRGQTDRVLRFLRLSNGEHAINIYFVLCAYIYMAIHDHREVESQGKAGAIPAGILLAIVEFMRHIRSIIGVEGRGLVGCVPNFGAEQPHYAIGEPVGG